MIFFSIAAAMMLVAGLVIALPLWRARAPERAGIATANLQVHGARLEELETDLENGRLSREDYAAARRDLEVDISISTQTTASSGGTGRSQPILAGIALLALLALAGPLYWYYGSWRVGFQGVEAASTQAVVEMVDRLAQRLQTPEGQGDMQGWDMLGHSYMIMGRYVDAMRAFEHARSLSHDGNAQYLAGYAEALALSHPGDPRVFMQQAMPVFEKVLQMDPNNTQALWYGGIGALERGDKALALKRWNIILAQHPPADYRAYIEKAITDAGGNVASSATTSVYIGMRVSLAPELAAKAPPGATVFIYARPKGDASGPPLAVRRITVDQLPMDVRLSDQDAVVPSRVLSAFEYAIVTARVSLSGDAAPHPGDLIGQSEWIKADGKPISIVIDTVVK